MARNVLLVERAGWAPSRTDASHDQATGIVDAARRAVCRDPVPDHAGRCPDRGRSPPCSGRALQPGGLGLRLPAWMDERTHVRDLTPRHSSLSRAGSLSDRAILPGECVAAALPAGTAAADRDRNVRR